MSSDLYLENNKKLLITSPDRLLLKLNEDYPRNLLQDLACINPLDNVTLEWKTTEVIIKGPEKNVISFLINKGLLKLKDNEIYIYSWVKLNAEALKSLINYIQFKM